MTKLLPFSLNFLFYVATASSMPFLVLYYQSVGLSGAEIGLIMGLTPLITLFSAPLWTGLADAMGRHRLFMSGGLFLGAGAIAALPFLTTFLPILLFALLASICLSPVGSFLDSATLFMLGKEKRMYGRVRVGGTIGYGLAAAVAGIVVQDYGLKFAFWGGALFAFAAFLLSLKLVHSPAQETNRPSLETVKRLLNRRWLFFLVLALASGASLALSNNYLFPYMKQLGSDETMMGLALTVGTISEAPVLFFGNRLTKRFGAHGLLMLAMGLTVVRLLLLALVNAPVLVLGLQLLNGPAFPAMWLASVAHADDLAPEGMRASAQGLLGAMVFGFGAAIGNVIGGLYMESLGGHTLYLVFGLALGVVVAAAGLLESRLPAQRPTLPEYP